MKACPHLTFFCKFLVLKLLHQLQMDFDLLNMLYSMFFWFWWNFQSNIAQESSTQKPNQFLRGMSYEFNTQNNAAPCMLKPHFHYSNVSRKNCLIIFHAWSQQNQSKNLSSLETEAFQPTRIYAAIQEGQRSQHVKIVAWHPSSLIYNACQYPEQLLNTDSTTLGEHRRHWLSVFSWPQSIICKK